MQLAPTGTHLSQSNRNPRFNAALARIPA